MHTNPEIFKAYDIRGVYNQELTDETAYRMGRSFGKFLKKELSNKKDITVVLGRDMRDSGTTLIAEAKQGFADEGIKILDIGLSSTPMMYYSVLEYGTDGGMIITASHNPAKYNGFKLVRERAVPISGDTGIYEIRDMVMNEDLMQRPSLKSEILSEPKPKTLDDYIENVLTYRNKDIRIKPMKIVVDNANGMSGPAVTKFFSNFPEIELIQLFEELDGNFPNHEANPLKEETLDDLKKSVKDHQADFGVACDGDFDRVSFVDDTGRTIRPDITTALLAPSLLIGREGAKILYDLRSSNITPETIEFHGGIAMQTRVGHSFIKAQMIKEKAFFSGEFSGHFYLDVVKDGHHAYFENPLFVVLKIMELLSDNEQSLSRMTDPLFVYTHSGEINFEISRPKEEILEEIKQEFSEGQLSLLDGIRIDLPNAWLSVRASNTEPVLRLITEGKTKQDMIDLRDRITAIIEK